MFPANNINTIAGTIPKNKGITEMKILIPENNELFRDAAQRFADLWQKITGVMPETITEPEKLLNALRVIREDGYAVEDGEYKIGLRSVSAPVWDRYGHPRYALGVVGLFRRVASPEFQDAIRRVTETASQLSELLKSGV